MKMIDLKTKQFYLVGANIKNSLSPLIHTGVYAELGLNADYGLYQIQSLNQLNRLSADGINVTMPFKTEILNYLHHNFSVCGSINTVKILKSTAESPLIKPYGQKGLLNEIAVGYSTDGQGFLCDAKRLSLDLDSVIILGSGGAARAIAYALKGICSKMYIFSRNHKTAKALCDDVGGFLIKTKKPEAKLLINCTGENVLHYDFKAKNYYDLRYTGFEQGTIGGLGMLIYQAILADEIFFNTKIDLRLFNTIEKRLNKAA